MWPWVQVSFGARALPFSFRVPFYFIAETAYVIVRGLLFTSVLCRPAVVMVPVPPSFTVRPAFAASTGASLTGRSDERRAGAGSESQGPSLPLKVKGTLVLSPPLCV